MTSSSGAAQTLSGKIANDASRQYQEVGHLEGLHSQIINAGARVDIGYSQDDTKLIVGQLGVFWVWTCKDGKLQRQFQGKPISEYHAISEDGLSVLSPAVSLEFSYWSTETGAEINRFKAQNQVTAIALSPDGKIAASAGDETIHLWDVKARTEIGQLVGHKRQIKTLSFSRDGSKILSGGNDNNMRLWDVQSKQLIQAFDYEDDQCGFVLSATISNDGKYAVSSHTNGIVLVWDVKSKHHVDMISLPGAAGGAQRFPVHFGSDDKQLLIAVNSDVLVWDLTAHREVQILRAQTGNFIVTNIAVAHDAHHFAVAGSDGFIVLYGPALADVPNSIVSPARKLQLTLKKAVPGPPELRPDSTITITPDARRVIFWQQDKLVVYDIETGSPVCQYDNGSKTHCPEIVAVAPDGKHVLSNGSEGGCNFQVWDSSSGKQTAVFSAHKHPVRVLSFMNAGKQALSLSSPYPVELLKWDIASGNLVESKFPPDLNRGAVEMVPLDEGNRMLLRNVSGELWVENISTANAEHEQSFRAETAGTSSDGGIVLNQTRDAFLAGVGNTIFQFKLGSARPLAQKEVQGDISILRGSQDGKRAVLVTKRGYCQILDVQTMEVVWEQLAPNRDQLALENKEFDFIFDAVFTPDGGLLLVTHRQSKDAPDGIQTLFNYYSMKEN